MSLSCWTQHGVITKLVDKLENIIVMVSWKYLLMTVIWSFLCCAGEVTSCDGRQNKAQCYGALGGTVVIQLMDNLPEKMTFPWLDRNRRSARWTSGGPWGGESKRLDFISRNGTVRMNELLRTDAGEYRLQIRNKDGKRAAGRTAEHPRYI